MRIPSNKHSKGQVALSYDDPVPLAFKRIFLSLLETMCSNESGVKEQINSEFLHDYRVAVRRTRSLLGQLNKVIPPHKLQPFHDEYAWLSTLTGPARDYDVMLLKFADYQAMLSDYDSADFLALSNYLQQQRMYAYDRLSEALQGDRYAELKQHWQDYLESDDFMTGKGSQYKSGKFVNKRIVRVYKDVLSEGESITPKLPIEAFHQLRKSCKKLRYLIEMFRALYPVSKVRTLIKELKKLQDDLGELQDLEAHTEILQDFMTQNTIKSDENKKTREAVRQLIDKMHTRKQVIMKKFHKKFSYFASNKNIKLTAELFGNNNIIQ